MDGMFPWNNSDIIKKAYSKQNYKVEVTDAESNNAIIFCSSNALYFPNSEEVFNNVVMHQDRYEWENIAKLSNIRKTYKKIIFIRDVYKQWYIRGINNIVDSIPKLIEFLKEETSGYKVTICGNSAGGYIAVLIGGAIRADKILNFSGQYDIWDQIEKAPFVKYYSNTEEVSRYFNILDIYTQSNTIWDNVIHIYPAECKYDIEQVQYIKNTKACIFAMKEKAHGITVRGCSFSYFLCSDIHDIKKLRNKFGEIITQKELENHILTPLEKLYWMLARGVRKIKKLLDHRI